MSTLVKQQQLVCRCELETLLLSDLYTNEYRSDYGKDYKRSCLDGSMIGCKVHELDDKKAKTERKPA